MFHNWLQLHNFIHTLITFFLVDIEVKSNLKCWKSRFCRYVQYKYSASHETRKKAIQRRVFHRHIQNEFSVICWTKQKIQALYSPSKSDFTNAEMLHINGIQRRLQPSNPSLMMQLKKKIRSYTYIYIHTYIYTHTYTHIGQGEMSSMISEASGDMRLFKEYVQLDMFFLILHRCRQACSTDFCALCKSSLYRLLHVSSQK